MSTGFQTGKHEPIEHVAPAAEAPDPMEAEIVKAMDRRKIDFYQPYPKQIQFHDATGIPDIAEIALVAGNQVGKTLGAAAMTSYFLTGEYPKWWKGRRFLNEPVRMWAGGPTSQSVRDGPQKHLLGNIGEWGTGFLPGRFIVDVKKAVHGVPDAAETVLVRHVPTGKISTLLFKSYDQGRLRWQGETLHCGWGDEEPPADIYSEFLTRCQVKKGFVFLTLTPLLGMSEVMTRLLKDKPPHSCVIKMGLNDAEHYSEEQRAQILARYPLHEREARAYGNPIMGSGLVFPVPASSIMETPIQIPAHWPRIAGLDLGWDHPTAAVWLAIDRDTDTVHVYDEYKMREQTPVVHAAAIRFRGAWVPMAWPHDGQQADLGSGRIIAQQYREQGVNMLKSHATHPAERGKKEGTGGYSLEAGVMAMLDRMQTGRFKVSNTLTQWLEEYSTYYREDGKIIKRGDDLLSATRVAIMSLRFARCKTPERVAPVLPEYHNFDSSMGVLG